AAFRGALAARPATSGKSMEPGPYVRHERVPPMRVPRIIELLGEGWERYDVGAMGEFDTYLLLQRYAGQCDGKRPAAQPGPAASPATADESTCAAQQLAPKWRGGYYYAAHKKGMKAPAGVAETATVSVFYVSRWASADDAQAFAAQYAKGLPQRYGSVETGPEREPEAHATRWRTEQGEVVIEPVGNLVLVTESFDPELGDRLRAAALAAESAPANAARP